MKIELRQVPRHANYTDEANLLLMAQKNPEKFKSFVEVMFSAKHNYSGNALSSLIGDSKITIKGRDFEQKYKADDFRPLVVVENVEDGEFVGQSGTTFKVKFDTNYFLPSDNIVPVRGSKEYICRIQEGPIATHGNGFIYVLQRVDGNPTGVPTQLLQTGQEWSKMFATSSEADIQGGSTQFAGEYTLYNKIGKVRKEHEVTDYAHQAVVEIHAHDNGKTYSRWIPYLEAKLLREFEMEKERAMIWSRKPVGVKSAVGYDVDGFPGVIQQLEDGGNNHYYSKFSVKLLEEYLSDIYFSRVNPGEIKRISAFTGYHGLVQASQAMKTITEEGSMWRLAGGNQFNPVKPNQSQYHPNSYSYGFNYSSYISDMGIQVDFIHMPLLDDRRYSGQIDPVTGKNIDSMMYLFLDLTGDGMTKNIKKVERENSYIFKYVNGLIGPNGNSDVATNSKEAYQIHISEQIGLQIDDISRCGMLVYQPNSGF